MRRGWRGMLLLDGCFAIEASCDGIGEIKSDRGDGTEVTGTHPSIHTLRYCLVSRYL